MLAIILHCYCDLLVGHNADTPDQKQLTKTFKCTFTQGFKLFCAILFLILAFLILLRGKVLGGKTKKSSYLGSKCQSTGVL